MSDRRPADPFYSPRTGAFARSPAERLEPTRPPARPGRQRRHREPRASRPIVRLLSGVFTIILLLMLVVGGGAALFETQIESPGPLPRNKVVVIPKGEGTHEIAMRLEREGAVSDRRLFIAGYLWSKFAAWLENGKPVQLKAGDYEVRQAMSVRQIVDLLSDGKTITYRVTVPEGLTSFQIVERLKADASLTGEIAEVPPEGSLLPETFIVDRGSSRQAIIDRMLAESRKLIEKAWAQRKKDLPLKTPEEAIILASIVEKETGRNDERERVAAVFINRLRQNMRLQSDPTILYGMTGGKTVWSRTILRSDIIQKTTHNTYQIDGLPPTPICNPGRAAIEATLNPADTKDLFFVADGNGGHVFSETLKGHNANVQRWRVIEKDMRAKAAPVAPAPAAGTPAPTPAPAAPSNAGDTPTTGAARTRAVVRTVPKAAEKENGKKESAKEAPPAAKSATPAEELPWAKAKQR